MSSAHATAVLDQLLDPFSRCLTVEVARALVDLRADAESQARIEELADKSTEGTLTPEEREEYEAYVWGGTLIGLLQAKAGALLANDKHS